MPEISRFFGIVVTMYYNDHRPAHFHARYGSDKAIIGIESPTVLAGQLPPRALGLVMEWASIHQRDLADDWALAREHAALKPIPPLE